MMMMMMMMMMMSFKAGFANGSLAQWAGL